MELSFGARLRLQRERQQVSLRDFAGQTKIQLSLVEGLERDDVSHWPGGIFRRAYVRAYARAIGLDPEAVLREFLELYPDPVGEDAAVAAIAEGAGDEAAKRRPPMRLRFLIGAALDSLQALRTPYGPRHDTAMDPATPAAGEAPRPASASTAQAGDEPASQPLAFATDDLISSAHIADEQLYSAAHAEVGIANDSPAEAPQQRLDVNPTPVAQLCTRLARARGLGELAPLMTEAAEALDAVGLIVWMWDPASRALWPLLSHGYPDSVLIQLPCVPADADNAVAEAFRSGESQAIDGTPSATGAVVIPLITAVGCGGVLALEFRDGGERSDVVCAYATIVAAQLSTLVWAPTLAQAEIA